MHEFNESGMQQGRLRIKGSLIISSLLILPYDISLHLARYRQKKSSSPCSALLTIVPSLPTLGVVSASSSPGCALSSRDACRAMLWWVSCAVNAICLSFYSVQSICLAPPLCIVLHFLVAISAPLTFIFYRCPCLVICGRVRRIFEAEYLRLSL